MKGACVNKGRLKGIIACNGLLLVCRLRAGRHSHFPTARRRREAAEAAEGARNCFINLIWHACVSRTRTNRTLVFKTRKALQAAEAPGCNVSLHDDGEKKKSLTRRESKGRLNEFQSGGADAVANVCVCCPLQATATTSTAWPKPSTRSRRLSSPSTRGASRTA